MSETRESLGTRIAKHRAQLGWTQQELADRIGISRTALSHLEAGMRDPGERTITLLAGVFKVEPLDLVENTAYPPAKTERLPLVTARYTEVEHTLDLLDAELALTADLAGPARREHREQWEIRLAALGEVTHDERERVALASALRRLRDS